MTDTEQVIDWTASGYFRFPVAGARLQVNEKFRKEWDTFASSLARLKAGVFGREEELWTAARNARSWQVSGAYAYLIGNTASLAFMQSLRPIVGTTLDVGASADAAECLGHSGLLSEIPALLDFVETYRQFGEFEGAVWTIFYLLDDGTEALPGVAPKALASDDVFRTFEGSVLRRVDALSDRFGTATVRILQGSIFSVPMLLEKIRASANSGKFDPKLRQIFEATTGVDCSEFFHDHKARPLNIHAVLDEFEERGGPDRFLPGKRYFFGHPVPD
ncbi:MAG: hypothetical protein EOS10_07355 [Mesorhizobium sp.]|uniref:hypothetical protein n=1 Tax=Mesorhizobium sp. TaxID=1871066 RepID=UPI000FE7A4ED|nr:hypothetical protein [Mesorhizobium sp.]RWO33501.1 MAG: hypothetical protein EOS10_07355 [Mesorhizobium sp.]